MKRQLFWKLILVAVTGIVAMIYTINVMVVKAEEELSFIDPKDRNELRSWGKQAQQLHESGNNAELLRWLNTLQDNESI